MQAPLEGCRPLRVPILVASAGLLVVACSTRPLVIRPRIPPAEFAPVERLAPVHLQSFADERIEPDLGFLEVRKVYQEPLADVFNDTLLTSLRAAQAFERVDRNQPGPYAGYVLTGEVLRIETRESRVKFALAASTMQITAECVTRYRLQDPATGEILLEEELVTVGEGAARQVPARSMGPSAPTSLGPEGPVSSPAPEATMSHEIDSTVGYEASISDAMAQNVAQITARVTGVLAQRAAVAQRLDEDTAAPPVGAGPTP